MHHSHCCPFERASTLFLPTMHNFIILPLLFLSFVHALPQARGAAPASNECDQQDVSALLDFRGHVAGSNLSSWSSSVSCCEWSGVTCGNGTVTRRVVEISLQARGLNGTITRALGNLTALQQCNLSQNYFHGILPEEVASLSQLRLLDISSNSLAGDLSILGTIQSLQVLNVSSNLFTGSLRFVTNLTSLERFFSSNNSLGGNVPTDVCQHAPNLRILDLSANNFSGRLEQGLGQCVHLEVLDLGSNQLIGSIPRDVFNLTSLTELTLARNNFSGILDAAIGNLGNLTSLLLGFNNLTGGLPGSLAACSKLRTFTANSNHFEGAIGLDFGGMLDLQMLDLNTNSFSGSIPTSLTNCTDLQSLNMAKNELSGIIPPGFNELRNLSTLMLSSNRLSGSLRSLTDSVQLVSLILSKNLFNETLSDSVNQLTNLQVLALGNVNLAGTIPDWLRNCTKLQVLDLSWNHLHGPLPSWLGSFQHLFYVDLSNNSFAGTIPPQLFELPTLARGDANRSGLQSVINDLAIKQKVGSPELQYTQVSAFPPSLYLSHNMLSGSIPSQVGNFKMLLNLDLSFNNLSGNIPETLASLTDLEDLDLSHNDLQGTIPLSLSQLTFLAYFNVSYNDLYGQVPTGNQFSTFSNKSYEGNAGLCGTPLTPCKENVPPEIGSMHSQRSNARLAILVPTSLVVCVTAVIVAGFSWKLSQRNAVYQGNVSFRETDGPQCLAEALTFSVELFHSQGKLTVSDLFKATNSFDQANIVGCGGFGLVYRADLVDGSRLAIKKLNGDCGQMEREFRAEVEALSKAQHKNLVSLQGYFQVGNDRLLLYSYMENGSLDYWLHERNDGGTCLDWPMRLKIAQGAAHGLAYLHQICNPHIVHRDIKSSNILLDEKFEAHLADFGLARLMMSTDSHVTTELVGTLGYIPPEYSHALNATLRGDVYSFGVVLLELLTRKRPVDVCKARGACDLVAWVLQWMVHGKPEEIFDSVLRNKGYEEQMVQVLDVACPCINTDPLKRPTIRDIVVWLDKIGQDNVSAKSLS